MNVAVEAIFILLLILANGVLAMSEIAVVSARRARLQQRAEEGDAGASAALSLMADPNRFLSTVQIGITLVGTLAGAFGGATIARELADVLKRIPWLAPSSDAVSLVIVVVGIAYLSLVWGELAPKRVALNNAEAVAAAIARPMRLLSLATAPIVRVLSLSTELTLKLLGVRPSEEPPVTEEEIRILLEQGRRAGVFQESEQDIVENVFRLGDRRVSMLITPRTEVVWLDADAPDAENWHKILHSPHDEFPVYQGGLDNVLGLVSVKALWAQMINGQQPDLRAALVEPLFVPESAPALKVLDLLKRSRSQMALVLDEYGGILGLVTLFDLLEGLVGEIPALDASGEMSIVQRDERSWLVDGLLPIDEFKEYFALKALPGGGDYQTVGGFVMAQLDRIPRVSDHFAWQGWRFEVVDMDGLRVDKVLVTPAGEDAAPAEPPDGG